MISIPAWQNVAPTNRHRGLYRRLPRSVRSIERQRIGLADIQVPAVGLNAFPRLFESIDDDLKSIGVPRL
ncbi:MAG: hypothetical protein ACRERV_08440 [Methylococcales bacterium]